MRATRIAEEKGAVQATLSDGTTVRAKFLLGADGPAWLDERDIPGRFVALDGEIVESSHWRGALACT